MVTIPNLTCKRIVEEKLSKDDVMKMAYDSLNERLGHDEAAFLFSALARAFNSNNIFEQKSRLLFRDDVVGAMSKWLNEDYNRDINITPKALARFCTSFSDLQVRPPAFFRDYLNSQIRLNANALSAKDGSTIIEYFSDLGIAIPSVLFDAACKPFVESSEEKIEYKIQFLSHMALLSIVNGNQTYREFSPHSVYERLIEGVRASLALDGNLKPYLLTRLSMAVFWFEHKTSETSYPYKQDGKIGSSGFQFPKLEGTGITLTDCFSDTHLLLPKLGIDAVYSFPDNRNVGCIVDSRSYYVSQMGKSKVSFPNGRAQFNSAALKRVMPDDIIVRFPRIALKNMSPEEIKQVIVASRDVKPGVYGLGPDRKVIPFREMAIVA